MITECASNSLPRDDETVSRRAGDELFGRSEFEDDSLVEWSRFSARTSEHWLFVKLVSRNHELQAEANNID